MGKEIKKTTGKDVEEVHIIGNSIKNSKFIFITKQAIRFVGETEHFIILSER